MLRFAASFVSFALAAFLAFAPVPVVAAAAGPDVAAYRNYTLSIDKLNRYWAATEAMYKAMASDPAMQAEAEAAENEDSDTLAQKRALFARHPKMSGFYTRQGLSIDDAIIAPIAAANAFAAVSTGNEAAFAQFVSPAQMAFAKANQPALKKLFDEMQKLDKQQ
jgi:hypothetical protein